MSLLAVIISLILESYLPPLQKLRSFTWFTHYSAWVRDRLGIHSYLGGNLALLVSVMLPVGLVWLIQAQLHGMLMILSFIFSIIVLLLCLGPRNPLHTVHLYKKANRANDQQGADAALQDLLETDTLPEGQELVEQVTSTILIQTHERILAILFWFVLLGPMGALLYRLSHDQAKLERHTPHPEKPEFTAAALRLHDLLAWLPAQLAALSYAVMGSFTHALRAWKAVPAEPQQATEEGSEEQVEAVPGQPGYYELLTRAGMGALQFDSDKLQDRKAITETYSLCKRSVFTWLTVLAIMTMAGWAL